MGFYNKTITDEINESDFNKISSISKEVKQILDSEIGGTPKEDRPMDFKVPNEATAEIVKMLIKYHLFDTNWKEHVKINISEDKRTVTALFHFDD